MNPQKLTESDIQCLWNQVVKRTGIETYTYAKWQEIYEEFRKSILSGSPYIDLETFEELKQLQLKTQTQQQKEKKEEEEVDETEQGNMEQQPKEPKEDEKLNEATGPIKDDETVQDVDTQIGNTSQILPNLCVGNVNDDVLSMDTSWNLLD